MESVTYLCPRFPGYEIGNLTGAKKVKFRRGVFAATLPQQVALVEGDEWFGVHILRHEKTEPSIQVSKTAMAAMKRASLDLGEVTASLNLEDGTMLTVPMVKEYIASLKADKG